MAAYYNEIDDFAADWLENLIAAGHIAPGVVDRRSIADVIPNDLRGFSQCHFFAGIGVWSHALRLAGWPDDRPVWTGSCPCQPFSAAGRGAGFADERHLWPAWFHLVEVCRPPIVLGEQVASKDGLGWLDLVSADLEGAGYAVGASDLCAAGVGAPHIRQRLYWMAHASGERCEGQRLQHVERTEDPEVARAGEAIWLEHPGSDGQQGWLFGWEDSERKTLDRQAGRNRAANTALQVNGFWRDADWLYCRDAVWRPVEPGTFPLADGATTRVGRLRAYGNAISPWPAKAFIEAVIETISQETTP